MTDSKKIPIYFMPGLAASSAIFERIKLDKDLYTLYFLEWIIPYDNESLEKYVKRLLLEIKEENPVLVGVSFGGIIIQEMAKFIKVRQLIVISSVVNESEFPLRMIFAKKTKLYYLFPTSLFSNYKYLNYFMRGKRFEMYKKFLSINDKKYLDWAFKTIINWKSDTNFLTDKIIRIHGDADEVFPIKNINLTNCYVIPKATHAMIVYKHRWFNKNLPIIIKQTNL